MKIVSADASGWDLINNEKRGKMSVFIAKMQMKKLFLTFYNGTRLFFNSFDYHIKRIVVVIISRL